MQLHLKKGERVFINGAVLQVAQRCSLKILNNVSFLLENHVMQPEQAVTPFRQLYFVVQTLLMDPGNAAITEQLYWHQSRALHAHLYNRILINGLLTSDEQVRDERYFEALKTIRGLYATEAEVLAGEPHVIMAGE